MDWNTIATNVTDFGINLIAAAIIFFVGRWLAGFLSNMVEKLMVKGKVDETLTAFTRRLCYVGILVFSILAAVGKLGIPTTSFIAVLGAAGLAIGFALQGTLSNFASGIMLILFRPFQIGDIIEAGGAKGKVKAIQMFNTHIISPDNAYIIMPNAQVLSDSIINYSRNGTRRVDLEVGVGYQEDLSRAQRVMMEALTSHPKVLKDPVPTVAVATLADSSVNFVVRPWCKVEDYWTVYFDCTKAVKEALDKEGISIPYPQTDLHIVSSDLPQDKKRAA